MTCCTSLIELDDEAALDPELVGAKAANLAVARRAGITTLPGVILTTRWTAGDTASARAAWQLASAGGTGPVIVRSSSAGEDGAASSMAGVFESVLGVADESSFDVAVARVVGSADDARRAGLVDAPIAVLVQPMVVPRWGGVLFGADPVSGRRDRLVVAAVPSGPDALVSGEVDGWTALVDRRGRVRQVRTPDGSTAPAPPAALLRKLARLAALAGRAFGGPQDIEWAVDRRGELVLLQARPITALPSSKGPVFGPGPVAESFPDALAPLEEDLWLAPLRQGLREALLLAGSATPAALDRSGVVVSIGGMAAVDLGALGVDQPPGGLLRRLDPRPPARRLRAAWRVGRLRRALPGLAADVVHQVDVDLRAVPRLDELSDADLLAVVRNGRASLVAVHGYEALAGLLLPESVATVATGASVALTALAEGRAAGLGVATLLEVEPVLLALAPPRIGGTAALHALLEGIASIAGPAGAPSEVRDVVREIDAAAVLREALRLRVRWLQELMALAAWDLGARLSTSGVLARAADVRLLGLDELVDAVHARRVPADVADRIEPATRALPARFRLGADGAVVPIAAATGRRRRRATDSGAVGAGGGSGTALVQHAGDDLVAGSVLVVAHLDPRLAAVIPRLGGLVAETGSPLSHLAILAREHRVPVVVGVADATSRFPSGTRLHVDGDAGTVTVLEPVIEAVPSSIVVTVHDHDHDHDHGRGLEQIGAAA